MNANEKSPLRLLSWNMAHVGGHWRDVASGGFDVALLQEAVRPQDGLAAQTIPALDESWVTAGANRRFCAAIARLSERVTLRPILTKPLADAGPDDLPVSLPGTLVAGELGDSTGNRITIASVYGAWSSTVPWKKGRLCASTHF